MDDNDIMADALSAITFEPPDDPEAHNTVTDFVDYTEYFPSDLIRSLTLIRNLDERYREATLHVHDLTTTLGKLPTMPTAHRPEPADLRDRMSKALQQAIIYREAACAEAKRLAEGTERNKSRLTLIRKKLQAMPLPPSRDPTPPPASPQAARSRRMDNEKAPKLTLHVNSQKNLKHSRLLVPGEVLPAPGPEDEVFTQTEDSSVEDIDESREQRGKISKPGRKFTTLKVHKISKTPKALHLPKPIKPRPVGSMGTNVHSQVAGISTSNALALLTPPPQDAKPGSKYMPWFKLTEYEMALLRKSMKKNAIWTPSDTMIRRVLAQTGRGPENYEKARILAEDSEETFLDEDPIDPNKTVLGPGEVMPNLPSGQAQSLENRGMRLNVAKKEKALKQKLLDKKAAEAAALAEEVVELSTKKPKKDKISRKEQSATERAKTRDLEKATLEIGNLGMGFKDLFSTPSTRNESITITIPNTSRKDTKSMKKRKRDTEKDGVSAMHDASFSTIKDTLSQAGPKKLKINHQPIAPKPMWTQTESGSPDKSTTVTTTTTVPLAPAGSSLTKTIRKQPTPGPSIPLVEVKAIPPIVSTAAQFRSRRTSGGVRSTVEMPDSSTAAGLKEARTEYAKDRDLRPRSRGSMTNKAASAEPPSKNQRGLREKRRASVVEAHPISDPVVSSIPESRSTRTRRRPAPGFVTDEADGKGKVSVGKRKAAPKKRGIVTIGDDEKEKKEEAAEEIIDPDEPRYCICGDVSWGTMVACENNECEKEWFHLDCVGLSAPPTARQKWYCPECRETLKVSEWGSNRRR